MTEVKNSGLGVASLIIGSVAFVLFVALFVIIGIMESSNQILPKVGAVGTALMGLMIFILSLSSLLAIGLGIGGLMQNERKKNFSIWGIVVSIVPVAVTIYLIWEIV